MNKYRCTALHDEFEFQKGEIIQIEKGCRICILCLQAHMKRHDRMLELLKEIVKHPNCNWDFEVEHLLKEIGELNERINDTEK
jgi:hypothetical protein